MSVEKSSNSARSDVRVVGQVERLERRQASRAAAFRRFHQKIVVDAAIRQIEKDEFRSDGRDIAVAVVVVDGVVVRGVVVRVGGRDFGVGQIEML